MWKILVVDDEVLNRKLIRESLTELANCVCVASGAEAIEAFELAIAEDKPFDIVLLDIAMPEMDGVQALKRLREIEEKKGVLFGTGTPILMVTAFTNPFMKSFREGADGYIVKPLEPDKMIEDIRKVLDARKNQKKEN